MRLMTMIFCLAGLLASLAPLPSPAQALSAASSAAPAAPVAEAPAPTPYWRSAREGWFWYQDPVRELAPQAPERPISKAKTPTESDLEAFTRFKKQVEESLHAAVQNPSVANIARYLELQAESRRKASAFTDLTRAVAMKMPWLSATADGARPTNLVAASAFDRQQRVQQDSLMQELASTHGLYFFYRSDCPYCHSFAPMLKQFELKTGITVFAVSVDGGPIPHFPNAVRDNGIFLRILTEAGIPPERVQVPFTALAAPASRQVLPLGFGVMTADELVERISLLVRVQQGQAAPTRPGQAGLQAPSTSY